MADLLQYLISSSPIHKPPSSQRSRADTMQEVEIFSTPRESPQRTMAPELRTPSIAGPAPEAGVTTNGTASESSGHAQGMDGEELPIIDIDDPRMQALLNSVPLPRRVAAQVQSSDSAAAPLKPPTNIPVQIGKTHSAAHIIEFYKLCQERALTPTFTFTSAADRAEFGVQVTFGGYSVVDEGPFASKKEAKEVGAEKGVKVLKDAPVPEKFVGGKEGEKGENWVGILSGMILLRYGVKRRFFDKGINIEYCAFEDIPQPSFTDYAVGQHFACEATITKRPDEPFGSRENAFPTKKAAKANAAKEAVLWLRQDGHLSADGPSKKKRKIAGAILAESPAAVGRIANKETISNAQKVNGGFRQLLGPKEELSQRGLSPPEYRFTQDPPGFYTGAAYFPREPEIQGPIGEIRHTHGIKHAKDDCARQILLHLEGIIKARGVRLEDVM
ncbi:MAG: hypothetical protein M1836_005404 [Candelina mexicana]|nr:MAG: hypothetical protein M1836_005404 [Candelina mexicana]